MPYIEAEKVKQIRNEIKSTFKDFKISVVRTHGTSVDITILEAPFNMLVKNTGREYEPVNHYYIGASYAEYPHVLEVLAKIYSIASRDVKIIDRNTDYGNWPNYYVSISIGRWDEPFKVVQKGAYKITTHTATRISNDDFGRKKALITISNRIYTIVEVDGKWHTTTTEGEPWYPIALNIILNTQSRVGSASPSA